MKKNERSTSTGKERTAFRLGLKKNAADSLATAIDFYLDRPKATWWKYCIMLTAHAVELYLKLRLAMINEDLLFDRERPHFTIGYDDVLTALHKHNIALTHQERGDIKTIRRMRNALEHFEISIKKDALEHYLALAMRFLDQFLETELETDINAILSDVPERFREFKEAIYEAEEWLRRASEAGARKMPSYREISQGARGEYVHCGDCKQEAVVVADEIAIPICEYCRAEWPDWQYCDDCGTPVLGGIDEDDIGTCQACWESRWERFT